MADMAYMAIRAKRYAAAKLLILVFFIQGIKVVRHEGLKPSNLLSVFF